MRWPAAFAVTLAAAFGARAEAQQTPADVISFLVTNRAVQTGDFQKDQAAAEATRDTITRALLVNLAAMPIQTSSSGFVYRLDPELGTMTRVSSWPMRFPARSNAMSATESSPKPAGIRWPFWSSRPS